ncbi:MAG: hypothetical protein P4L74_00820 [Candidatus Doudnabacteria bacterium]|nr:hypothetical protein [Candidatus Doudnabacteria bacterium]
MKYFIYILAIIILLGVNIGLFGNLPIRGQSPNLLLLLTVYFSVDKSSYDFYFIAFACGLFLDCFSASFFGGWTFGFLILALALHTLSSQLLVLELNWKSLALLVFGSFSLVSFCLWFYTWAALKAGAPGYGLGFNPSLADFVPALIYNLLLLYPMYFIYYRLKALIADFTIRSRGVVK